jgi:hypothetical protein
MIHLMLSDATPSDDRTGGRCTRTSLMFALAIAGLLMLSGCATIGWPPPAAPVAEPVDLNRLMETVAALRETDPKILREGAEAETDGNPEELLGWALVLIMLDETADKAKAAELIKAYLNAPGQTPGALTLASLMLDQLQSEARLRRRLAIVSRQRDDLNSRVVSSPGKARTAPSADTLQTIMRERDELTEQLEQLKTSQEHEQVQDHVLRATIRERDELTEQLEELKSIEINIRERKRGPELDLPSDDTK